MNVNEFLAMTALPEEVAGLLRQGRSVNVARGVHDLEDIACGPPGARSTTVSYDLPDGSRVEEVDVVRLTNGVGANYPDPYMRRRDPPFWSSTCDRSSRPGRLSATGRMPRRNSLVDSAPVR